jgi:hypothetical protein
MQEEVKTPEFLFVYNSSREDFHENEEISIKNIIVAHKIVAHKSYDR